MSDLVNQITEAIACCRQQSEREMQLVAELDRVLSTGDERVRLELAAVMERWQARRRELSGEVVEAVFEIVGEPVPELPKRSATVFPPPLPAEQPRLRGSAYDHESDPLNIHGRH